MSLCGRHTPKGKERELAPHDAVMGSNDYLITPGGGSDDKQDTGSPRMRSSQPDLQMSPTPKKKRRNKTKDDSAVPRTPNPSEAPLSSTKPSSNTLSVMSPLPVGVSLLNLTGPPAVRTPESPSESPSKKRRRRKKKNKNPEARSGVSMNDKLFSL